MSYKVQQIAIPKLRNGYLTDMREVRFENDKDITYLVLDCIKCNSKLHLGDKVEINIRTIKFNSFSEGWESFPGYLCVSAHKDGNNYYVYEFYKEGKEENEPYSQAFVRSKGIFDVGETYIFEYRKVK